MSKTRRNLLILIGSVCLVSLCALLILLFSNSDSAISPDTSLKPGSAVQTEPENETSNLTPQPPKTEKDENPPADIETDSQQAPAVAPQEAAPLGELPTNWHRLSAIEKVALNPLNCDIRVQILYASDASCHYYRPNLNRSYGSIGNRVILEGYLRDSRLSQQERVNILENYCQLPQAKDCVSWSIAGGQKITDDPLAEKNYPGSPALRSYRKLVNESAFKTRYQAVVKDQLKSYGNCQAANNKYKEALRNSLFQNEKSCRQKAGFEALRKLLVSTNAETPKPQWLINLRFQHRLAVIETLQGDLKLTFLVHPSEHRFDRVKLSFQGGAEVLDYLQNPSYSEHQKIEALEDYCNFPKKPKDCGVWAIAGGAGDEETSDDPLGEKTYQANAALQSYRGFVGEPSFQSRYKKAVANQLQKYGNCQVGNPAYNQARQRSYFQDAAGCQKKANFLALNSLLAFSDSNQQTPDWLLELRLKHKLAGIYSVQADTFFVFLFSP